MPRGNPKVDVEILKCLSEDINNLGNDLRFNLCIQLLNTGRLVEKYMVMRTKKIGQNQSHMQILYTIIIHGGVMRPSDISRMLFQSKQTVTQIIKNLEKDRLVIRGSSGKDGRTRAVFITAKGLNLVKESLPTTLEIANSSLPALLKEEILRASEFLKKVRKHLYTNMAMWY